jgi:hypothetical protein
MRRKKIVASFEVSQLVPENKNHYIIGVALLLPVAMEIGKNYAF